MAVYAVRWPSLHSAEMDHRTEPDRGKEERSDRKDRRSLRLSPAQRTNVIKGAVYALRTGVSLNRFITINWTTAGIDHGRAATRTFLKWTGDWLRVRGVRLAYIRVREGTNGDHVHILLHVPKDLIPAYRREQGRWLRSLGVGKNKGSVKTEPVGRSYSDYLTVPAAYAQNLRKVVKYLMKDGGETGMVEGLRASVSESLNQHARRGFVSARWRRPTSKQPIHAGRG